MLYTGNCNHVVVRRSNLCLTFSLRIFLCVLKIGSLQAQIAEQAKLAKEQSDALLDDRRVKEEECETRRCRDEEKIRILTEK